MRLTLEFIDGDRGVRMRTEGDVPGKLMVRAIRDLARDHLDRFVECSYWYSDHSRATGLHWTVADMSDIAYVAETFARVNPGLLVANWATNDLVFGMARMWEALASELGLEVLTSRSAKSLENWLVQQLGSPVDPHGNATLAVYDSEHSCDSA